MRNILNPLLWSLWASVVLSLAACQPESKPPQKTETVASAHDALIQQIDGFQVSFDITTMADHHHMMESMKMEMPAHGENMPSHYVMVTVLNSQKKPVADLSLKIKVISPGGTPLVDASGVSAETMIGQGMTHYGHGFDFKETGRYQVLVMFAEGNTVHQTGVYWEKPE